MQARAHLVREDQLGFNPNPTDIPEVTYLAHLEELRGERFLAFHRRMADDGVMIIKVITNAKISKLQEAVLLCNLDGKAVLVNLKEVSIMSEDARRKGRTLEGPQELATDRRSPQNCGPGDGFSQLRAASSR